MCVWVTFFGYENTDIRNHPRISSRILAIIQSFGGRDGSDKIDVRWGTTVLFAISDQSTCLWALLVATLMGVSKISNNTVLRKYIGLQHIQRSGS